MKSPMLTKNWKICLSGSSYKVKRISLAFLALFFFETLAFSQNLKFVRGVIDTLASPEFYGRGYVNNGDKIASEFILKQLKKDHFQFFNSNPFQQFNLNINTFPGEMELAINGEIKKAGIDYLVMPDAQSMHKKYKVLLLNENTESSPGLKDKFNHKNLLNKALVIDTGFKDLKNQKIQQSPIVITINEKLPPWEVSASQVEKKHDRIIVDRHALPQKIKKVSVNIVAKQIDNYQTQNVVGYISGKVYPDSFIVFGAHYDHLGMMGSQACFPGASDNGSGTAMLLDLAAHYSNPENQPDYSMAFIFFSGEEAGLLGSEYYTSHPLFPLKNIKFMINLDMVGTGSEGIKVVNGSIFKPEFEKLKTLNEKGGYLKTVSVRGEAANSDHYFFYKNGVKCFFIYTLGNEDKEYHTVGDKASILPLTKYPELFKLVCDFVKNL
jgi:aminopeptidase YwaD